MRIAIAAALAAALLLTAGCSERVQELSTTDPQGTLPVPSDAGPRDPSVPQAAPVTATTTAVAAPDTSGDDSGFDADTTRTGQDVPAPATTSTR